MDAITDARTQFVKYMREFLAALGEVYPNCKSTKQLRLKFGIGIEHALNDDTRTANEQEMIVEYHTAMLPYYQRVQARDQTVIADAERQVSLLQELHISTKWQQADADIRTCIFEYLDLLNRFSQMYALYTAVPKNMMGKIEAVAHNIAADLDTQDIGALDLAQLGQQVVSQIDEKELERFAAGIMQHPQQMTGLMSMMGAMQPPAPRK